MDELEAWLRKQLDEKLVEPNSTFGEATEYMLNRRDKLTRFHTVAGPPKTYIQTRFFTPAHASLSRNRQ